MARLSDWPGQTPAEPELQTDEPVSKAHASSKAQSHSRSRALADADPSSASLVRLSDGPPADGFLMSGHHSPEHEAELGALQSNLAHQSRESSMYINAIKS